MTGVSKNADGHGSNVVYQRLRQRGYQVFAINPNTATMHRSFGGGSVSPSATDYGRKHGITVTDGGCPLMFDPAADGRWPPTWRTTDPRNANVSCEGTWKRGIIMITGRSLTRTRDDLHVVALSEHEWRISDRRIAADNALSLVGFIDKNRGAYEVMEFVDPVEYARFRSLEDAISYFVTATPDAAY